MVTLNTTESDIQAVKKFIETSIVPVSPQTAELMPVDRLFPVAKWCFDMARMYGHEPTADNAKTAFLVQMKTFIDYFGMGKEIMGQVTIRDIAALPIASVFSLVQEFATSPAHAFSAGFNFFQSMFVQPVDIGPLSAFSSGTIPNIYRWAASNIRYFNHLPDTVMQLSEVMAACDHALTVVSKNEAFYNKDDIINAVILLLRQYPSLKESGDYLFDFYEIEDDIDEEPGDHKL